MTTVTTKRHIMSINGRGFLVMGTTGSDGKTRIPQSTFNAVIRAAGYTRGQCVRIG